MPLQNWSITVSQLSIIFGEQRLKLSIWSTAEEAASCSFKWSQHRLFCYLKLSLTQFILHTLCLLEKSLA
jgi:hypothetical protein